MGIFVIEAPPLCWSRTFILWHDKYSASIGSSRNDYDRLSRHSSQLLKLWFKGESWLLAASWIGLSSAPCTRILQAPLVSKFWTSCFPTPKCWALLPPNGSPLCCFY